jgi:hypothetical protein
MPTPEPTIATILRRLATEHTGPVAERQVLEQVLAARPSTAKNPFATIRERLRWDGLLLGWLRLSRNELMPLHAVLQGLRFRCIPHAADLAAGILPIEALQPFVGLRDEQIQLYDPAENLISAFVFTEDRFYQMADHYRQYACDLREWYQQQHVRPGDSVLITVQATEPFRLKIEHEPASAFQRAQVSAQDAELLNAIVERVNQAHPNALTADEVVLAIFATASWRTAYPGTPWQQLVAHDPRLHLIENTLLSSRSTTDDAIFTNSGFAFVEPTAATNELLNEIETLQRDLRHAREEDADQGIWDGQLLRSSAAYGVLDTGQRHFPELDGLDGFESDGWGDDWDPEGPFDIDERLADDPVAFHEAQQTLLAALPPEAAEKLLSAGPEEAELIIASHLNLLLVRAPSLFPHLEPPTTGAGDFVNEPDLGFGDDDESLPDPWDHDAQFMYDLDNHDWDDETAVQTRSTELIDQFSDYLGEMGKSNSTIRQRMRDIAIVADFLAAFYGRTLAEADYATLDECLFYHYPRRTLNSSPRRARELCTVIKQFYRFLLDRGEINDDRFAQALWRRRSQVARVVELYDRISSASPQAELLITRLFKPYTE